LFPDVSTALKAEDTLIGSMHKLHCSVRLYYCLTETSAMPSILYQCLCHSRIFLWWATFWTVLISICRH